MNDRAIQKPGAHAAGRPEVSIVIVAYRARDHVLRCLLSIAANVEMGFEVIVVDDGSGDGTPEAVSKRFPWVRVIAKERNEGLAAGRNSALPQVAGRKVLMLDSDTEVLPGSVETLAGYLDQHPEAGIAAPRLLNPDGTTQLSARRWPAAAIPLMRRGPYSVIVKQPRLHAWHLMEDFDYASERPVLIAMGAAQMWRSDLPQLIGRYDERISSYGGEDFDWCMRVWEADLQVRFVPGAEIVHEFQKVVRRRGLSRHSLRALRDWYYILLKHRRLRRDPRIAAAIA